MKRYLNLTFSALNRGLERFKTQRDTNDAPSSQTNTPAPNNLSAAGTTATPPPKSNSDNEELLKGVRYLQNYSATELQEIVSRVMAEISTEPVDHAKVADLKLREAAKLQEKKEKDFQTWWLLDLIAKVAQVATPTSPSNQTLASNLDDPEQSKGLESAKKLMTELFTNFNSLTTEFNDTIAKMPELSKLRISTTEISTVKEKSGASYIRCRTSSASWSLNIRGSANTVEIFLVPSAEIFLLSQAETAMRLKNVLRLSPDLQNDVWSIDNLTANSGELAYFVRTLFKNLLLASTQDAQDDLPAASILQNLEGEELRDAVNQIILGEQNMAQKIVSQQEEIQNRIARDLHDAIIADIMSLKRLLSGDKRLNNNEVVENLDQICTRLREICHDLAPRDLKDWGLQTVIEDLVERLAHRTGADCSFTCDGELPELPYPVQLHIYRIVQESLNNMEKYSKASKIIVKFEIDGRDIRITMKDNGQGFSTQTQDHELRSKKEGGTGLSGIKERTEMIRCFFKTNLSVTSTPGEGSETVLEVKT